MLIGSGKAQDC
jgi:hypothetical protein